MPDNVQTQAPPSVAALVGDIINDAQRLVRQEITLARTEMKQEWNKAKTGAASLGAGGVILLLGGILLCHTLVYLLFEVAGIPRLWACYLIVGALVTIVGGALLYRGVAKINAVELPPPQTTETLKEIV
jgi:drug/metabolite transporter (DMT)-like permease